MKRKINLLTICAVFFVLTMLTISNGLAFKQTPQLPPGRRTAPQVNEAAPDHVIYGLLFERVVSVKKKIRELQGQGRIARKPTYALQKEAQLSEAQAEALEGIAFACREEVARQDEKAKTSISAYRAQFPNGKIPDGVTPPPPPPELKVMWEERNAMILRARDRLRTVLGEESFRRFDRQAKFPYGADDESVRRRRESAGVSANK